jgi:hypothetical protein
VLPAVNTRDAATFLVTVVDLNGRTVLNRRYPYEPVPLPRYKVDSAFDVLIRRSPAQADALRAIKKYPPSYTPVGGIRLGTDYSIWIELRATRTEEQVYLVLDRQGAPFGHLVLPRNARLEEGSLSRAWVTVTQDDGLQALVLYALRPTR